jgi:hypothetical protein
MTPESRDNSLVYLPARYPFVAIVKRFRDVEVRILRLEEVKRV